MIVSAFIAGLAFSPRLRTQNINSTVFAKMEDIGHGFLIAFLFISIGTQTDLSVMTASGNDSIVILAMLGLVASKTISGWFAMKATSLVGQGNNHWNETKIRRNRRRSLQGPCSRKRRGRYSIALYTLQ